MRKVTATEKYRAVNEGQMSKKEFVRQMRQEFPMYVSQYNGFDTTVQILKNRGLLFEAKKEVKKANAGYSLDALERGIRVELAALDVTMPWQGVKAEDYHKAEAKAKANLEKNPNHYLDLMSGESNKVDKHDKEKEVKRGAADKDTFNDMKKATLKEGTSLREQTIDLMAYLRKEKGATDDQIKDFIKTHFNDIKGMSLDQIGDEYDEFFYANYEVGADYADMEEAMSDDMMKKVKDYGKRPREEHSYKLGDTFKINFDYDGMLQYALDIDPEYVGIDDLEALSRSFEDVNYHRENTHLSYAIDAFAEGNHEEYFEEMEKFQAEVEKTLKSFNEGVERVREGKKQDHDGDGDIDGDDYMAAKDKAIKKAMGKKAVNEYRGVMDDVVEIIKDMAMNADGDEVEAAMELMEFIGEHYKIDFEFGRAGGGNYGRKDGAPYEGKLKESVKNIITKILQEEVLNEAATAELARIGEEYDNFDGLKSSVIALQNIVTEIESFYDKTRDKIQKIYDDLGEVRNEEGLKVGAFIAPSIENAFRKDMRHIIKGQFTNGLELPKVKKISQADIDTARAAGDIEEEPKQTMFTPVNEKKK